MFSIDSFSRDVAIERYVTDIVGGLNFLETKEMLKDLLIEKKQQLSSDELESEIMLHDPGLLADIYIEEILEEV